VIRPFTALTDRFNAFPIDNNFGIVGAFVSTFLGQAFGWYRPGEGAGLIGAFVGAIIVLLVYGMLANRRTVYFRPEILGSVTAL
jgi:uncharacterized membrane protein